MDELEKALAYARDVGVSDRNLANLVKIEADRVRFQSLEGVTLTHPGLDDREITVPESSVEQYEKSGWVLKPTDEPTEEAEETPTRADLDAAPDLTQPEETE